MPAEVYDEAALKGRLSRLSKRAKTAFAAACAESLVPLQRRYWSRTGLGRDALLRDILDSAWDVASGGNTDVRSLDAEAAAFGPSDDAEWFFDMGYAQNGAAAVAYAIRTWLTDDAQDATWAARQVQEAAEYSITQPDLVPGEILVRNPSDVPSAADIDSSPAMRSAVTFLDRALEVCETGPSSWEELQRLARTVGGSWASTFR